MGASVSVAGLGGPLVAGPPLVLLPATEQARPPWEKRGASRPPASLPPRKKSEPSRPSGVVRTLVRQGETNLRPNSTPGPSPPRRSHPGGIAPGALAVPGPVAHWPRRPQPRPLAPSPGAPTPPGLSPAALAPTAVFPPRHRRPRHSARRARRCRHPRPRCRSPAPSLVSSSRRHRPPPPGADVVPGAYAQGDVPAHDAHAGGALRRRRRSPGRRWRLRWRCPHGGLAGPSSVFRGLVRPEGPPPSETRWERRGARRGWRGPPCWPAGEREETIPGQRGLINWPLPPPAGLLLLVWTQEVTMSTQCRNKNHSYFPESSRIEDVSTVSESLCT